MPSRRLSRRAGIVRYGSAIALVTAVSAVGLSTPALAAPAITPNQTRGPALGTNNISLTGITFPATPAVQFQTDATCTANYSTPSTASPSATRINGTVVSGASTASLVVTVPATLTAGTAYNICVYPGT